MVTYFNFLQQSGTYIFGQMYIVAIILCFLFLIAMIMMRIKFKWALLAEMPLIFSFVEMGWLASWVGIVLWMLVGGFLLYAIFTLMQNEYF